VKKIKFKNLTIQKKMLVIWFLCLILPFMILGFFISNYISQKNVEMNIMAYQNVLRQLTETIDTDLKKVQECAENNASSASVKRIINGNADIQAYMDNSALLTNQIQSYPAIQMISFDKGTNRIFQRGEYYANESDSNNYFEKLLQSGKKIVWTDVYTLESYNSYRTHAKVFSCLAAVYNLTGEKVIGDVNIALNTEILFGKLADNLAGNSHAIQFVNADGTVLMSSNEEELGKPSNYVSPKQLEKEMGYFNTKHNNQYVRTFYATCSVNGFYIVNVIPRNNFSESGIMYIILSVLLCLLFGIVNAGIQRNYILKPLQKLSLRIDLVKSGILEAKSPTEDQDEIGRLRANFEEMIVNTKQMIEQIRLKELRIQEAEREALLAQMNPHFLYNTLDSIHWTALKNKDYLVSDELEALSEIFRHILNFGQEMTTVEKEFEYLKNYIFIMQSRFRDRFQFIIDVERRTHHLMIPKLMIQPLVENAILHGLAERTEGGKVKVKVKRYQDFLHIVVLDNGEGADEGLIRKRLESMNETQKVFALKNIDERIKLYFGEAYGLKFYSKQGMGCMIKIVIPVKEDKI